jgi:outer membrane receptor protein involved in Fe transport
MEYSERPTADPQNLAKTGDTLASGLLGIPLRYFGYQGEISALEFWTSTWSAFVQDEWKLRPDLTLTYGMRFDFVGRVHGKNQYMLQSGPDVDKSLWIIASETTPPPCSVAQQSPCLPANSLAEVPFGEHIVVTGEKDSFLKQIRDNFGPRVGLAWQLDEKTVLRGGYGLQWDALPSRSQYGQHQFEAWGWPQSSGFDTGTVNAVGDPIQKIE